MPYQVLSFEDEAVEGGAPLFRWGADGRIRAFSSLPFSLDLTRVALQAAHTDGMLIKAGDANSKVSMGTTANAKAISAYFKSLAESGSAEGIYARLYAEAAGTLTAQVARFFTTVQNVEIANARGVHASLSFGASGSITGEGEAIEATLHIPTGASLGGTVCALKAAVNSDGSASDPVGAKLSAIRIANQGDATGKADVDDDCAAIQFDGWGVGDGNMIAVKAAGAAPNVTHSIRLRLPDDSLVYLYAGADPLTA